MKTLNLITIGIMVPTLVVSAFSMNVSIPWQHHPFAFWIVMVLAAISVVGLLLWWKHEKAPSKAAGTGERIPRGFQLTPEDESIEQWYNPKVQWVLPDTPLAEVADKMWGHHIHHLFVKDARSKNLVGVITTFDLLGELTGRLKNS